MAGYGQPRVLGVFGISHTVIQLKNRKIMRKHPDASIVASGINGVKYDNGHFMSHLAGGSIDLNLFPQRRDVNRGWGEWARFRIMEKYIAQNPAPSRLSDQFMMTSQLFPQYSSLGSLIRISIARLSCFRIGDGTRE